MVAGRGFMPRPRKGGRERSDGWKGETRSGFPLQVDGAPLRYGVLKAAWAPPILCHFIYCVDMNRGF